MLKTVSNSSASISIYQLLDSFDLTEANLNAFIISEKQLTTPVIIKVDKANKKTTWIMLGSDSNPTLYHVG
jgi:plasmid maintenance system antidote protein VapI